MPASVLPPGRSLLPNQLPAEKGDNDLSLLVPTGLDAQSLDFDQFQRYSATAQLLDRLLIGSEFPVHILEVGSNVLNLLPRFLDPARICVTRCDVDRFNDGPDFVLIEKDKPWPFPDESFDAVAALEVLEHMPAEGRRFFISECLRVSRRGLVFTCPNGVPEVEEAESLAAAAFRDRNGKPHPFLNEHQQFGLPREEEVLTTLREWDHPHAVFDNAPLDTWLPMMMLSENLTARNATPECHYRVNQFFLKGERPSGRIPYRKIYVVAKQTVAGGQWLVVNEGPVAKIEKEQTDAIDPRSSSLDPRSSTADPWPLATVQTLAAVASDALCASEHARRLETSRLQAELNSRELELPGLREQHLLLNSFMKSLESSWSWKMLEPLRALRRLLAPRGFDLRDLLPWSQLEPMAEGPPGRWLSQGTDPQFLVPCYLPAGWLRIRLKMTSQVQGRLEIYVDSGHGFTPAECVERLIVGNGIDKDFFVWLPRPIRGVRIDPLDVEGEFRLEELRVTPVPGAVMLCRALLSKIKVLQEHGQLAKSLGRGLLLLLRGRFTKFRKNLIKSLEGPSLQSPGWYDVTKAYDNWRNCHQLTEANRQHMRMVSAAMSNPPLISVLLPVYNVQIPFLRLAIESVLRQTYPQWELCIADDASTSSGVRAALEEYARRDARIKLTLRPERGNISAASNSALASATGEYVALLDHDDELAEQALFRVAQAVAADRSLDMIYSDEDKLEPDGRHVDPFFKPDWSPEYFLTCMYTCHLGVYRTALVRELGGFRGAFDTAQDYDLALRVVARSTRIHHVPDVLYHWRKLPNSTARSYLAKPQAHETAGRALESYLQAIGRQGTVESGMVTGLHRVRFTIVGRPKISIVIPSASRPARIRRKDTTFIGNCVKSIRRKTTYKNYEIIAVDNDDMPPRLHRELDGWGVRCLSFTDEFNLASKMNLGAAKADGDFLVFLNDDVEVITPDWLESMLEFSQLPEIGAVGAKLLFPDGRLQHVGVVLLDGDPIHPYYGDPGNDIGYCGGNLGTRNFSAVTGACLMTRAELFHDLAGFDERFSLNYNDIDYCLRLIAAGRRVVFTPFAELYHYEGATKSGIFAHELAAFKNRWGHKLNGDPYYNPNLSTKVRAYRIQTEEEILAKGGARCR
jgi:glycosyltransferase involved in cell wall biosynthesis